MTKPPTTARILARAVLLIGFLASTAVWLAWRGGPNRAVEPASDPSGGGRSSALPPATPGDPGTEPAGPGKRSERRSDVEGRARGDGSTAPESAIGSDAPDVIRSQVRGLVPAGHSMVTGGHLLADGSHEFAVVTPKWMEMPNGSKQIEMEVQLLNLDDDEVKSAGLDTLLTGERKSEQNAEVWTPEETARTMKEVEAQALQAKPRVIVSPGSPARMTVGDDGGVQFELELSATEAADGGFELATDLKRIE